MGKFLLVACVSILSLPACSHTSPSAPSSDLWVPSGGLVEAGPDTRSDGLTDMSFSVAGADPKSISEELRTHLHSGGWKEVAGAHRFMWEDAPAGGVIPDGEAVPRNLGWSGAWEDASGNVLEYRLKVSQANLGAPTPVAGYTVFKRKR